MGNSADLLRLLEPTVRPGGLPGPVRSAPHEPIESRSFDSILGEARRINEMPADDGTAGRIGPGKAAPLRPLSGVDVIENASLRRIVGGGK